MKTIELMYPHSLQKDDIPETIAAIGFFDGIHKGHQKVIQTAVQKAKEDNQESAVITFHPHPSVILKQSDERVKYITPLHEKERLLQEMGVDRLYIITFNKELSLLSPEKFIDCFINDLHIKHLVAGFDFTFGHKGAGNMDSLDQYTNDCFTYSVIDKLTSENEKISSTNIRKKLQNGAVAEASELLGRKLRLQGIVVQGDQRGRTIGYPTANLEIDSDYLLPKQGVYAVEVIYGMKTYKGMANLGVKPTFKSGDVDPSVEVHLLDFDGDLYGKQLIVLWYEHIRDEIKFNGIESLVKQLNTDEERIRNYFR